MSVQLRIDNVKYNVNFIEFSDGASSVEIEGDDFVLYDCQTEEQEAQGELKEVFRDGELLIETSLSEIRGSLWG